MLQTGNLKRLALGAMLLALSVVAFVGSNSVRKGGKAINSFAGAYIVYADAFRSCDTHSDWAWHMKVSHWNPANPKEAQRLTGTLNGTKYPFSDAVWVHVVLDVRSNNMWKENAFVFNFPSGACSAIRKHIPDFFRAVFSSHSPDPKTPCSVPPRVYEVHNEPVPWIFPNVPVLPYGTYRFRLGAGPPGTTFKNPPLCLIVEGKVVPKT